MNKQSLKCALSKIYFSSYKSGIVILNYHSVQNDNFYSVKTDEFEKQICYLKENYSVMSLTDIKEISDEDRIHVIITFDDGYEDNYLYAYPILKKYNLPATIFITSDFVFDGVKINQEWPDYRGLRPLKVEQMGEMQEYGINFGSHSKSHSCMSSLTEVEFIHEVKISKKVMETYLHQKINSFAYPFGQVKDRYKGGDVFLKEAGYEIACTTDWGINKYKTINLLDLRRIRIDHNDTIEDFKNKMLGRWQFVSFFQKVKNSI